MRKQITAPTYNDDRTERYENEPVTILFDVDEYKELVDIYERCLDEDEPLTAPLREMMEMLVYDEVVSLFGTFLYDIIEEQVMDLMYSANCLGFIMGIKKAAQAVQEGACGK